MVSRHPRSYYVQLRMRYERQGNAEGTVAMDEVLRRMSVNEKQQQRKIGDFTEGR